MFEQPNEVVVETYREGSADTIELVAGSMSTKCLGSGTVEV